MLTPSEQFFYTHAGYSYDPKIQTQKEGRVLCAKGYAAAEQRYLDAHRDTGAYITWEHDEDGAIDAKQDRIAYKTCEWAAIRDSSGLVLASLGGILDADDNTRRVIRAELAIEAFPLQG